MPRESPPRGSRDAVLDTAFGRLRGHRVRDVVAFQGIPYAQAPRFAPPAPATLNAPSTYGRCSSCGSLPTRRRYARSGLRIPRGGRGLVPGGPSLLADRRRGPPDAAAPRRGKCARGCATRRRSRGAWSSCCRARREKRYSARTRPSGCRTRVRSSSSRSRWARCHASVTGVPPPSATGRLEQPEGSRRGRSRRSERVSGTGRAGLATARRPAVGPGDGRARRTHRALRRRRRARLCADRRRRCRFARARAAGGVRGDRRPRRHARPRHRDADGRLTGWLRAHSAAAALVRPDF